MLCAPCRMGFELKYDEDMKSARRGGDPAGMYIFSAHQMDVNLDGYPDLVFICDFGNSRVYFNDGNWGYNTTGYGIPYDQVRE